MNNNFQNEIKSNIENNILDYDQIAEFALPFLKQENNINEEAVLSAVLDALMTLTNLQEQTVKSLDIKQIAKYVENNIKPELDLISQAFVDHLKYKTNLYQASPKKTNTALLKTIDKITTDSFA
jgi:hypothetical protein